MRFLRIACAALLVCGALSGCSDRDPGILSYSQPDGAMTRRSDVEKPEVMTEIVEEERKQAGLAETAPAGMDDLAEVELTFASKYYMENMTPEEQTVYRQLLNGIRTYQEDIPLSRGAVTSAAFYDMMVMVAACQPEIEYLDLNYTVTVDQEGFVTSAVKMRYDLTPEEVTERNNELSKRIYAILSQIDPEWDDFEKYKHIHDAIITGNTYTDEDSDCYTAYGCLVEGRSVCEGYSKAAIMVCERAGLEIVPVMGRDSAEGGQGHIWDKIKLDGDWYVTDLTWDDPVISDLADPDAYVCYDYFAITDEAAAVRHEPDENRYMIAPECTSYKDDYYIRNSYEIADMSEAEDVFRRSALDAAGEGGCLIRVRCADWDTYEQFGDWIYGRAEDSDKVFDIIGEAAEANPEARYVTDGYSVIEGETNMSITVELRRESPDTSGAE